MSAAGNDLVRILEIALCHESGRYPITSEIPDVPVSGVVDHRISLSVLRAREQLGLNDEQIRVLEHDVVSHLRAASHLIQTTTRVSSALHQAQINHVVFKGVALGAVQGGVPSRGAGDVDLLVDPHTLPAVHEVLTDNGFSLACQIPSFESRSGWRVLSWVDREVTYLGQGVDVDLHWRISPQRHLFPDPATLVSRAVVVEVGETEIPTACAADALAMAAFHSYYDRFAILRGFVDIHRLIPLAAASPLPPFSQELGSLLAGVLTLYQDLFPRVADEHTSSLLDQLPAPLPMVRRVWDRWGGNRSSLRPERTLANLLMMFRAELACDSPFEAIPRYVGKRMLSFPPATTISAHSTLRHAVGRQLVRLVRGSAT